MFVIIITLANSSLLASFFTFKQKNILAEQLRAVEKLDINDRDAVSDTLSKISDEYNLDIEIYNSRGKILYTTHGSQMMDFFLIGRDDFSMSHEALKTEKSEELSGGIIFEQAVRRIDGSRFLLCRKEISDGIYAETRIQKQLITSSAKIASEFVMIIAVICFAVSVIWIFLFARKFSKPLTLMNDITRDMAKLDFSRRCDTARTDEIGELAASVNDMSQSLSKALGELKLTNARLRDEIETERQLDVMRKAFVANVSHELKTPIAIISGYAEGLKLNINSDSREEYCDTIIDESRRMNSLVLSILELSRYESGQIPLKKESFNIFDMTEKMLSRIFSGKNIITENLCGEDIFCFADPMQTEQVLKAYLENAAAHTPCGGTVTVKSEPMGEKVRISVHNTGSHISEELMPQIWQSFFRGDTSHKREESRFGLGLSIVNAVMRLHECDCGVYNTENGVCFWFDSHISTENAGQSLQL